MRLLSRLEYERSFGARWVSYFVRIPKQLGIRHFTILPVPSVGDAEMSLRPIYATFGSDSLPSSARSDHRHQITSKRSDYIRLEYQLVCLTHFGSEVKQIARLAGPIAISQLSQVGMGVTDTVMAGRLSAVDLAAVAIGSSLWLPVYLACLGVMMVIAPVVAQLRGANQVEASGQSSGRQYGWVDSCPTFDSLHGLHRHYYALA